MRRPSKHPRLRAALAVAVTWLCAGIALAQEAQDAAEQRSQSFQAVQGAVKEDVAGGPLLLIAYAAIFTFVLLYLIRLVRMQQRALQDIARLERVLGPEASRDAGRG